MRCRLSILLLYCLLFVVMFAPACAKRVPSVDSSMEQRWLSFLEDGKTTREEVLLTLGISTARLEGDRILSYMLLFNEEEGFSIVSRYSFFIVGKMPVIVESPLDSWGGCGLKHRLFDSWLERENILLYNLVLVFDCDGILAKHNFVSKSVSSESRKLAFLQDGKTTKEDVLLQFGIPSSQFEGERILTYWLKLDESEDIESGRYSLVLVFDDRQILEKHSMIKMKRDWSF
jgi:outer membrane protein assembly factor BamE (lipoprotein component of BamABCDE complex)